MRTYTARVIACENYMGNPNDKLIWHYLVKARSARHAEAMVRGGNPSIARARMSIHAGRLLG